MIKLDTKSIEYLLSDLLIGKKIRCFKQDIDPNSDIYTNNFVSGDYSSEQICKIEQLRIKHGKQPQMLLVLNNGGKMGIMSVSLNTKLVFIEE
ncbi:hypothetical protein [Tellurirhabdus bombi]|uniref:hypothetical protein n=1 Tax=Tellurirhabdus bombi TaxID=2907205 RepID=UPI001F32C766|nr:hypothetical protein [Tellurirhabdus bombi]